MPISQEQPVAPLSWMRVVDLTDLRGALCARILADFGADVIRVECGDPLDSLAHAYRNANKRGVVLDLDDRGDRTRLDGLLAHADVLVENRGVDAALLVAHPHLVHVALTDLGLDGPRAAWHLEALPALAASGALWASGFPDLPPCNGPGHLAHDCASVYGAVGAVAGVLDRARRNDHVGQIVEVSAQEAGLAGLIPWSVAIEDYLPINPLLPAEGKRNADGAYWVLPASDGWVRVVVGSPKQWAGFKTLLRNPDVFGADEWRNPHFRLANSDVIRMLAQDRLTDRTRAELFTEALGLGATVGVLHQPSEFVTHAQTRTRGFFVESVEDLEGLPFATQPVKLARTQSAVRSAARVDDDPTFVPTASSPPSIGRERELLLDGVRVVEFGVAAVVPEMCGVLSELGADVIKIESRANLDVLRMGSGQIELIDKNFTFNDECRGRRSVALDLNTERGREFALALCASADVVAENQRGGALERRGLGYDDVRSLNPRVVYVSSQGYGRGGPLGEMPAYGPLNSGFSGVHLLWNHPDAPYPCGTSMNHPDHIAGRLLAVGVLAALAEREVSGEGQHLELAQTEAAAYFIGEVYLEAARAGADPAPLGNAHPHASPHGVYPSAGTDQWVAVAVMDDDAWRALCATVGWADDPSLRTAAQRVAARTELDERLARWTSTRTKEAAAELLQAHGVSAMPVMGPYDHLADPHLLERGAIVTLHHPEVGAERHVGNPLRFSRLPQRVAQSAPLMGADTEAVLTSVLGLEADDVAQLVVDGVCR
ncbi:MAG TPA: CoA transferase [Acidimicrobiia bacterium]|nr:CoA transferase [Acidimicrobiia bacterium]